MKYELLTTDELRKKNYRVFCDFLHAIMQQTYLSGSDEVGLTQLRLNVKETKKKLTCDLFHRHGGYPPPAIHNFQFDLKTGKLTVTSSIHRDVMNNFPKGKGRNISLVYEINCNTDAIEMGLEEEHIKEVIKFIEMTEKPVLFLEPQKV